MSDGELVRQTLAGRTQAYEELVRRWAGRVTAMWIAFGYCWPLKRQPLVRM